MRRAGQQGKLYQPCLELASGYLLHDCKPCLGKDLCCLTHVCECRSIQPSPFDQRAVHAQTQLVSIHVRVKNVRLPHTPGSSLPPTMMFCMHVRCADMHACHECASMHACPPLWYHPVIPWPALGLHQLHCTTCTTPLHHMHCKTSTPPTHLCCTICALDSCSVGESIPATLEEGLACSIDCISGSTACWCLLQDFRCDTAFSLAVFPTPVT